MYSLALLHSKAHLKTSVSIPATSFSLSLISCILLTKSFATELTGDENRFIVWSFSMCLLTAERRWCQCSPCLIEKKLCFRKTQFTIIFSEHNNSLCCTSPEMQDLLMTTPNTLRTDKIFLHNLQHIHYIIICSLHVRIK